MNTRINKSIQVFLGILSGIGIWLIGLLMSGKLASGEVIDLYPTGRIVLAFPIVLTVLCIIIAKNSAKADKRLYYASSMISLIFPLFCELISSILPHITSIGIPVISRLSEITVIFFMIPRIPLYSILYQIMDITDQYLMLMTVCGVISIAGMLISIKIYKDNCSNQ